MDFIRHRPRAKGSASSSYHLWCLQMSLPNKSNTCIIFCYCWQVFSMQITCILMEITCILMEKTCIFMENLWNYQLCRWPWPCTEWNTSTFNSKMQMPFVLYSQFFYLLKTRNSLDGRTPKNHRNGERKKYIQRATKEWYIVDGE